MVGEGHHDAIIQPGIDESLACQDMLQHASKKPSLLIQAIARLSAVIPAMTHRKPADQHQTPTASSVTRESGYSAPDPGKELTVLQPI